MTYALFLVGCSFVLSLLLQPKARSIATRIGAIDIPDERKHHQGQIPRSGGLGVVLAAAITSVLGLIASDWIGFVWSGLPNPEYVVAALFLVFVVGIVDDIRRLSAGPKALVQAVAALIVWYGGIRVEILTNPFALDLPVELGAFSALVTVLWILAITNAFNLIDGLDGLASGLAMNAFFAFSLIALVRQETMILYFVAPFMGALLGFLPYNFPTAKAFLGDSGSYVLGFVLATVSLLSSQKAATVVVAYGPLLFVAVPVLDVAATMVRRFLGSDKVRTVDRVKDMFRPDRRHLHYLLVDSGVSNTKTTLFLLACSAVLTIAGLGGMILKDSRVAIVVAIVLFGFIGFVAGASSNWRKKEEYEARIRELETQLRAFESGEDE